MKAILITNTIWFRTAVIDLSLLLLAACGNGGGGTTAPAVTPVSTPPIERISVNSSGAEAVGGASYNSEISANGRYVVFESGGTNFVPGDTNGWTDIFVRDTLIGTTTRVSVDSSGSQANGSSDVPTISDDGRYIAFLSGASNLVIGDTNNWQDIFIRDTLTGTTTRVSVDSNGTQANSVSYTPKISANGRYVVFLSFATNLVGSDTNGWGQIFFHDTQTHATSLASADSNGTPGNSHSATPRISSDGRYVAFQSNATNLVTGGTSGVSQIFVRDTMTNTTTCVSVGSNGLQGDSESTVVGISGDGRCIVFQSDATNLVTGDTNGLSDIFVRDTLTNTNTRVSVDSTGVQGNSYSTHPTISADGRYIVFVSNATNLVAGDTNGVLDIFVRDTLTNTTTLVSVNGSGLQSNGISEWPAISGDGKYVTFHSDATNLVPGDTNAVQDVFRVRATP